MLSKAQIRFVGSLQHKKFRKQHEAFIVEGWKSIREFLSSNYDVQQIYFTADYSAKMDKIPQKIKLFEVSVADLQRISALKTPQGVLAVVGLPPESQLSPALWEVSYFADSFTLLLDGVQDPGNLGTIIRTVDWFGMDKIICSLDCADVYNPKTVQASMGSLSRVQVRYAPLVEVIRQAKMPVFGALLDGKSLYDQDFGKEGLIILGNEGKGISAEVMAQIHFPVTIPRVGSGESLNVAISSALFCAQLTK